MGTKKVKLLPKRARQQVTVPAENFYIPILPINQSLTILTNIIVFTSILYLTLSWALGKI